MKKTKIIIPALGILLLSTAASVTGTVAWFAMNDSVSATGMKIRAKAEDGILISNELDSDIPSNWTQSVQASYATLVDLAPTSTYDFATWYHNSSNDQNQSQGDKAASTYAELSATVPEHQYWTRDTGTGKSGTYFFDADEDATLDAAEKSYVLLNKFYIKSSGTALTLGAGNTYADLYVQKVIVTGVSGTADLDASLRVGIKIGGTSTIYAPVSGATTTYHVGGYTGEAANPTYAHTVNAVTVPSGGLVNTAQSCSSIPAITTAKASTVVADVFIYFEGEDAKLKSANLRETLDSLNVEVHFGITTAA